MPSGALVEIARYFTWLGLTAFGGPAVHISLMESELVRRRRWVDPQTFQELLAAANLAPGPTSTELALHFGKVRGGLAGMCIAGAGFILPAVAITLALAAAYVQWGMIPWVGGILAGLKPAVLAVVVVAILRLARSVLVGVGPGVLAAGVLVLDLLGVDELALLLAAGVFYALLAGRGPRPPAQAPARAGAGGLLAAASIPGVLLAASQEVAASLFVYFLKIGALLYGSGYVLLAFLQAGVVEEHGWLTQAELLDMIALGQFTPGPFFSTAAAVGYLVGGVWGGVAASAGIFLPAFVFVALSGPMLALAGRSTFGKAFLVGVNGASMGLMAAVALEIGRSSLPGLAAWAIFAGGVLTQMRLGLNPTWVMVAGAALGLIGLV